MRYVLLCALWATYCISSVRAGTPGDGTYEKRPDGIIIHIAHPLPLYPHTLSLQAITQRIIHVTAFPSENATPPLSLMRVPDPQPTARYEVVEQDSTILFSTDSLKVRVSLTTGAVTIMDNQGKVLLGEAPRDQPPFGQDTVQNEALGAGGGHAWKVSATFFSPPDESLYGLGQQQNGFLDYKGRSLTLLQQNSSVANPMVL
jgi:alpha-D-xyloside xylohydrolase